MTVDPIPPKDFRQLNWTIDTVAHTGDYQTWPKSVWGSSPSNVYAGGYAWYGTGMYHFDGKKWAEVEWNQPCSDVDINGISGTSANNIWMVGTKYPPSHNPALDGLMTSMVMRFDGNGWWEVSTPNLGDLARLFIENDGTVWTTADKYLLKYSSSIWEIDSLSIPHQEYGQVQFYV
jgi:hypothetical protein